MFLQDDDFMSLPYIDYMESESLIQAFKVDTFPQLQLKTKGNSSLFEKCLLPLLEEYKIETVNFLESIIYYFVVLKSEFMYFICIDL